jgi:hypothetical protein
MTQRDICVRLTSFLASLCLGLGFSASSRGAPVEDGVE